MGKSVRISHIVLFRIEVCFINWLTVLYETLKLNKIQLCMKCDPPSKNQPSSHLVVFREILF